MKVLKNMAQPTPKKNRKIRNIAATVAAIGTAILTSGIALPLLATQIIGIVVVAGGIVAAQQQTKTHKPE